MRKLKTLNIKAVRHLCYHLGCDSHTLVTLVKNKRRYYRSFPLRKNGSCRTIEPPIGPLKDMQRRIKALLDRLILPEELHGGVAGRSPLTNAANHVNKAAVLNFDIRSFYPSVSSYMVYSLFHDRFGCSKRVSWLLTQAVTFRNCLPQGAPTSCVVANLIICPLVNRLNGLATFHTCDYSQFVDDGAFSGPAYIEKLRPLIDRIISQCGFTASPKPAKRRTFYRREEQVVTGIKVNHQIDVPSAKLAEIRSLLRELLARPFTAKERASLRGKIAFISSLNASVGSKLQHQYETVAA